MLAQTKYRSVVLFNRSIAQNVLLIVLASIFLAIVSQVAMHLWWPVPVTLQSAAVVFMGITLGSKRAAAAIALYLFEGLIGLPVFAGGLSGLPILIGPSGGYLFGFLPSTFLAGFLMERGLARNIFSTFIVASLATMMIFCFGFLHLSALTGSQQAYQFGVKPFLLIELIKLIVVSFIAQFAWKK